MAANLKRIRLELARTTEYPEGSSAHGYEFIAPVNGKGHINSNEIELFRFGPITFVEQSRIGPVAHESSAAPDRNRTMRVFLALMAGLIIVGLSVNAGGRASPGRELALAHQPAGLLEVQAGQALR